MTYHRDKKEGNDCKEYKVPICLIEDKVKAKQLEHMQKTGAYLSIPRAIIQLILDKNQ
jgi:hypothetical protein